MEQHNVEKTLDELRQFRENVTNAESISFNMFMDQGAGGLSPGDWGDSELETEMEETGELTRRLMLQREREFQREREKETDAHPFPRPRTNSSVNSKSRRNLTEHGGARA